MAVLTSFNRYNGEIPRLFAYNTDGYVIDGKALNRDMMQVNKDPVEIVGNRFELISHECWLNDYNTGKGDGHATDQYVAQSHWNDCSTDNPVFGGPTFSHPSLPNENFVLSNRCPSGLSGMRLSKLADDGTIIVAVNITMANAVIVDHDGEYLYVMGYQYTSTSDRYASIRAYNHVTLAVAKSYNFTQYQDALPNVLARSEDRLTVVSRIQGVPWYFNKRAGSLSPAGYAKDAESPAPAATDYKTILPANYTPPMGNGWQYTLSRAVALYTSGGRWTLEGYHLDTNSYQYQYCPPASLTIEWQDDVAENPAAFSA